MRSMKFRPKRLPPINQVTEFNTNTKNNYTLFVVKTKILSLDGVDKVEIAFDAEPRKYIVYTSKEVPKEEIDAIIFSFEYKYHVNSILAQ